MNLAAFKLDIDDLIAEFVQVGGRTLADMKKAWCSKKFSHIFQASSSVKAALLMQSSYSHAISYMASTQSLSRRLGGLYCLYCLHETQPYKPPFRIYLSLGELKSMKMLVIDAKKHDMKIVSNLVKIMLAKNMFLFGSVELNENSHCGMVHQIRELQNARVQHAYEKLFANTQIEEFLHMDLDMVCDMSVLSEMTSKYAEAKKVAIEEAGNSVSVEDIHHIVDNRELIGNVLGKISEKWKSQRQLFHTQTGMIGALTSDKLLGNDGDELHEFGEALEMELLQEEPQLMEQNKSDLELMFQKNNVS